MKKDNYDLKNPDNYKIYWEDRNPGSYYNQPRSINKKSNLKDPNYYKNIGKIGIHHTTSFNNNNQKMLG